MGAVVTSRRDRRAGLDLLDRVDGARRRLLHAALRAPLLGRIVRDRQRRIFARVVVILGGALVLTIICPALTLAIGPVLFGIPHVASSVRYLVLRQRLPRAWLATLVVGCAVLGGLRMAEQWSGRPGAFARSEVIAAAMWALLALLSGAAQSRAWRRLAIALVLLGAAATLAVRHPTATRLCFVHLHNLAALVLWAFCFRRGATARSTFAWWTTGLLVAALALVGSGVTVAFTHALGGDVLAGVDLARVAAWLVPGAAASVAVPLVLAHAFTDSVHYAFWLGVVPEETLRGQGTLSFRMTGRALLRDFGALALAVIVIAQLALLGWALRDLARARDAYFAVVGFHGYVEGTMLLYLAMARQPPAMHCADSAGVNASVDFTSCT